MSLMGFGCGMDFDSDKAYRQGLGAGGPGGTLEAHWGHTGGTGGSGDEGWGRRVRMHSSWGGGACGELRAVAFPCIVGGH